MVASFVRDTPIEFIWIRSLSYCRMTNTPMFATIFMTRVFIYSVTEQMLPRGVCGQTVLTVSE